MRVEKNILLLKAHALLLSLGFFAPIILPFYRDQMGLTYNDFLFAEAFFSVTIVVLDVPTGWLSDQWQRKRVMTLGSAFYMLGYAQLLFAHNIFMAVLARVCVGVGASLLSGTNSAMLYESLTGAGRAEEYRKYEGQ